MRFTLGKPIFTLLLAAAASGIFIWQRPAVPRADLVVWSFDETHAAVLRGSAGNKQTPSLLEEFNAKTGLTAQISLMGQTAENIRLASSFMSGSSGPDLCEIEVHSIGQFLRPPIDDVGLLPLNDFLRNSGWDRRIIASRFGAWSKIDSRTGEQIIYGIPEDVHPVTITYRKDLFDEAGIDLQQAKTWNDFQNQCLAFQNFWIAHAHPERRAIALSTNSSDELVQMLLQRHVNLIDSSNHLHFTDPKVQGTTIFYANLIAGPRAIGNDPSPGISWTEDFERGNVCAVCTPDWKVDFIREFTPNLAGKVMMMPLPRFDPDDAPTSTWGGTMMGICRNTPHSEQAWKLLEFLLLSPEAHRAGIAVGDEVLPAIPQYWSDPAYHKPDAFFANDQSPGDLYVRLANQIPERIVTPYTFQAELALSIVIERSAKYLDTHANRDGLTQACATWLAEAQADIEQRIDFGNFQP